MNKPVLVVGSDYYCESENFARHIKNQYGINVVVYRAGFRYAAIEYVLLIGPVVNLWKSLPSLKYVQVASAGVDAVIKDIPPDVVLLRTAPVALAGQLAEYCWLQIVNYKFQILQHLFYSRRRWNGVERKIMRKALVLGMGAMGSVIAQYLKSQGMNVVGWKKNITSGNDTHLSTIKVVCGKPALFAETQKADVIICALPLTDDTKDILNADFFSSANSCLLINVGRGEVLVENDLVMALRNNKIASACLDVVRNEPFSPDSPLWNEPGVFVTPHIASLMNKHMVSSQLIKNLALIKQNKKPDFIVDTKRGY